jgi:hypothetical protein
MSFVDEIVSILGDADTSMHVDEIALLLASTGTTDEDIKTLSNRIASTLSAHVKSNAAKVMRTTRDGRTKGIYKIKKPKVKTPLLPTPDVSELSTNYVGKAGEHAVMSELLFWGFNVSLMAVDEGIDVIATKANKYFHIQVKTTGGRNAQGAFSFGIDRRKFERNNSAHTFYILVMRDVSVTRFVVLPSNEISRLLAAGKITGANSFSLKISFEPATKKYLLNGYEDVQPWINGFQFIR